MFISEFFSAANGGDGFFNLFGETFAGCDRLYVIKGGPGTGKSTFMRSVAAAAETRGHAVERIFCSSDPGSLDGLRIYADGSLIGFADGTAPHAIELNSPGVGDFLLDLGQNWDENLLIPRREQIGKLKIGKAAAYSRAYRLISAAADCDRVIREAVAPCLDLGRLEALAAARVGRLRADVRPERRRVFLSALGMSGRSDLFPFGEDARTVAVDASRGGSEFLRVLRDKAAAGSVSFCEVLSPLTPESPEGIWFPGGRIYYTARPRGHAGSRVSLRDIADAECFSRVREGIRRIGRIRGELISCALAELGAAGAFHAELEKIYSAAMDFGKNRILCDNLCRKLFGNA